MEPFRFGLMIRAQFPPEDDLCLRFEEVCATVRAAETLGFDCITKGSHYAADSLGSSRFDPRVLDAMARVPRHLFVPKSLRGLAERYSSVDSTLLVGADRDGAKAI